MHFCKFNLEFLGLGYDFFEPMIDNHGLTYFELYRCKKCGNLIRQQQTWGSVNTIQELTDKIEYIEKIGYLSIGILLMDN